MKLRIILLSMALCYNFQSLLGASISLLHPIRSYHDQQADTFGIEPLEEEQELFIKEIMQEMQIENPIILRKMNAHAMRILGRANAFAYADRYLFVSESFFKELSGEEKRFLIGHELAHCLYNHCTYRDLSLVARSALAITIGLLVALKVSDTEIFKALHRDAMPDMQELLSLLPMMLGIDTTLWIHITLAMFDSRMKQKQEFEADHASVTTLNCLQGGVAFLERLKTQSLSPFTINKYLARLVKLFSTHPPLDERIERLTTFFTLNSKDFLC